jgi:peptidylprolyl isomerase domain and WD repeat-containing protein 1
MNMSDQDGTVLGKRLRNNVEEDPSPTIPQNTTEDMDESDDDVGPMPVPVGEPGTTKKKRKGVFRFFFPGSS